MGSNQRNTLARRRRRGTAIVGIKVSADMVGQRVKNIRWYASGPSILDKRRLCRTIRPAIRSVQWAQATSNKTAPLNRLKHTQKHRVTRERPNVAVFSRPDSSRGGQALQPHRRSRWQSHSQAEMPIALSARASKAWADLTRSPTPLGRGIAVQNRVRPRNVDSLGFEAPRSPINIRCSQKSSIPWSKCR